MAAPGGRSIPPGRTPGLSPGDTTPDFPDFVNIVDTIGRLGVLLLDVEVKVSAQGGGCEGLTTVGTALVLGGLGCIVGIHGGFSHPCRGTLVGRVRRISVSKRWAVGFRPQDRGPTQCCDRSSKKSQ